MLMNRPNLLRLALVVWVSLLFNSVRAEVPEWIWHDNKGAKTAPDEVRYFRKTFTTEGKITKAILSATGDDEIMVYLNGHKVVDSKTWDTATRVDVTKDIHDGQNLIAIRGKNRTNDAAVIAML